MRVSLGTNSAIRSVPPGFSASKARRSNCLARSTLLAVNDVPEDGEIILFAAPIEVEEVTLEKIESIANLEPSGVFAHAIVQSSQDNRSLWRVLLRSRCGKTESTTRPRRRRCQRIRWMRESRALGILRIAD